MVRISKLTDYGMVIMAFIAAAPERLHQAREVAQYTQLSLPTVSKLLKSLAKNQLLNSSRGIRGGYQLKQDPSNITVADLIRALEGPIAITECNLGHSYCPTEQQCAIRAPWLKINGVITDALKTIKLSDLVPPHNRHLRIGEKSDRKN